MEVRGLAGLVATYRGVVVAVILLAAAVLQPEAASARPTASGASTGASTQAVGNFDNDAFAEVAIGVPGEDSGAGAVQVYQTNENGIIPTSGLIIKQGDNGVAGTAAAGDFCGNALAAGDFNNDGFGDLAVGCPFDDNDAEGLNQGGAVLLLYGAAGGLPAGDSDILNGSDIEGEDPKEGHRFGSVLVAGNFSGNKVADLAIGMPSYTVTTTTDVAGAGAVFIMQGGPDGLGQYDDHLIFQGWSGASGGRYEGVPEEQDNFGWALGKGNFGRGGHDDLAVSIIQEGVGEAKNAGALQVIYGTFAGPNAFDDRIFTEDTSGMPDWVEADDGFSQGGVVGANFGKSTHADLAVGAMNESVSKEKDGAVFVLYGSPDGLSTKGIQMFHQDSPGIPDSGEQDDLWGAGLAAGDVGKDGRADLVVGAPFESLSPKPHNAGCDPIEKRCVGQATIIFGTDNGLRGTGAQRWNQDSPGVADTAEPTDALGWEMAISQLDRRGKADLMLGVSNEDISYQNSTVIDAGGMNVLYGGGNGPTTNRDQFISQRSTPQVDPPEDNDLYGVV